MANFAFTRGLALPDVENGATIRDTNFTQREPHTKIYEGKTGLRFEGCNLLNCDVPPDSKVVDCLRIHKSFCSHLHPKWIEKGLPVCEANCTHVKEIDEISVDGQLVETLYHYEDKAVV